MSFNGVRKQPQSVQGCVRESLNDVMVPGATQGETLRFLRTAAGLSQQQLATKAGVAAGYVSEFEGDLMLPKKDQRDAIDGAVQLAIAEALDRIAAALRAIQARRVA